MPETKKVTVEGEEMYLTKVPGTNAWFQSTKEGDPVLNSGEKGTAEKAGNAITGDKYEIWVTIGPYRAYDIAGSINYNEKIIKIDLYSVRPGTDEELGQILLDAAKRVKEHESKICKNCGKTRLEHTGKEDYCPTKTPTDEAEKHIVPAMPPPKFHPMN